MAGKQLELYSGYCAKVVWANHLPRGGGQPTAQGSATPNLVWTSLLTRN